MRMLIPAAIAGVLLSGCATEISAYTEAALKEARDLKDIEAKTAKALACATSIGADIRVNTPEERSALQVLCGGMQRLTVTTEDILLLQRLKLLDVSEAPE